MASDQDLWVPPLSPKDQHRVDLQYKRRQKKRSFAWLGFKEKTFWDILHLLAALAVPLAVALGAAWFSASQSQASLAASERQHQTDIQIAADLQQETALQNYLDRMSNLLLNNNLKISKLGNDVRAVARSITLTLLPQLNAPRKREVVQFLYESDLIDIPDSTTTTSLNPIVDLEGADLSGADLREAKLNGTDLRGTNLNGTDLRGTNLNGTDLSGADLREANLREANLNRAILKKADLRGATLNRAILTRANLREADLRGADLRGAFLNGADLRGASVTNRQLKTARNLQGTIMPDGLIHL